MSNYYFNFLYRLSQDVKRGEVIRSKFATVGPYHEAVNGRSFIVVDDVAKNQIKCSGAFQAVSVWHKINKREMKGIIK